MAKVVAPPWTARVVMEGACALYAAEVKQVRHAHRKMDMAKQVDGTYPENYWQPYLAVAVSQMKQGQPPPRGP